MADTILTFPSDVAAWRRGAELAFAMLFEIEACGLDETAYDDEFRDRRPQKNFVAAYLAKLRDLGDTRCELAFASILTDHIASGLHSGTPCLESRRKLYGRAPIASEPTIHVEVGS